MTTTSACVGFLSSPTGLDEQCPDVLGDGEGVNVPALLVQLRDPGWRLPLDLEDLFRREHQVVDRLETRMTELAPVPNALAQFVEISLERGHRRAPPCLVVSS